MKQLCNFYFYSLLCASIRKGRWIQINNAKFYAKGVLFRHLFCKVVFFLRNVPTLQCDFALKVHLLLLQRIDCSMLLFVIHVPILSLLFSAKFFLLKELR